MSKEGRQEREREAMRILILETAGQLVAENGIQKLSIRKIAERMEYSPGIIYHYFEGKEDIIGQLLEQGYRNLLQKLNAATAHNSEELLPEEALSRSLSQFIHMAIAEGTQYRNILLNDSAAVLRHTAVLHMGASQERKAIGMLCATLRRFKGLGSQSERELELTAQVIWSAAFGLIIRLTVENPPEEQKEALISRHLQAMLAIASG
ncbi:TetR/AcrR family transcriptional regulator [Paenibacillus sp. FSL L8-0463]|uniref:TetR/AcrR family transcriptional regulator n=1 Tax=Paenibacillus sp. FSL L8-0463 TaxID=2954687 RepID=UPI00311A4A0E